MKFGLMFFAASDDSLSGDRYRLLLDSARFADEQGFSSVWIPERHFTRFGGLYPNPAVLHAALAMATTSIRLNAGSVVAPLHHPARIAEEWSVVDNLSGGRVGVSFASGWNPDDFVFFPERYDRRHEHVFETIREVQRLWRGESLTAEGGSGQPSTVRVYPTPVQPELPIWVTAAGNPRTFERAGASGANLLTHLLDQDEDVLASRIASYRRARQDAGLDPGGGEVTLMLHTFVGADAAQTREDARRPYCEYIKANLGLLSGLARSRGRAADLTTMGEADREEFVNYLYDRFAAERGLIGTPESCVPLVSRLERIGVTELACLLDFGPDTSQILANLPHLARLKDRCRESPAVPGRAAPAATALALVDIQARCDRQLSGDAFHAALRRHGIEIDDACESVRTVWRRDGEALASLDLGPAADGCYTHPAALDACSRIVAAALPSDVFDALDGAMYVPVGMGACEFHGPLQGEVWSHASIDSGPADGSSSFSGDVRVYDTRGRLLASIDGLALSRIDPVSSRPDVERWLYERQWQRVSPQSPPAGPAGTWLVAGESDAGALRTLIAEHGGDCVTSPSAAPLRGIVYVAPVETAATDADAASASGRVERAVRPLLDLLDVQRRSAAAVPIWIATRGAMALPDAPSAIEPAHAPLWGIGRVLAVERPGALGALVDLDPDAPADVSTRQLWRAMTGAAGEDMMACRGGDMYVPRLRRLPRAAATSAPVTFNADETVLITGGTGGLGLRLAAWLVARGAAHVVLVSRRAPSSAAQAEIDRLAAGAAVGVVQADVADAGVLTQQLDRALAGRPALTAVFHLAGVLDDGRLDEQTWERFARVLRAKVDGAWNLHRYTCDMPLRHFVMFSSMASLVAVPGQANYAAANAFLDALAHDRASAGLAALAVNWGPWVGAGHAETEYGRQAHGQLATLGIEAMPVEDGLRAMGILLQQQRTQAAAVSVDWPRLFRADPAASRLGLLADLAGESRVMPSPAGAGPSVIGNELRALPPGERRPHLLRYLSALVVAALKLRTDEPIDARQRLFDLGIDSILALELKDQLEGALGRPLSATLLFVYPTLESLAGYILDDIVGAAAVVSAPDTASLSEDELTALLLREIDAGRGR